MPLITGNHETDQECADNVNFKFVIDILYLAPKILG